MNEQLIVKNFGPIKDATVGFKRVTVFIGPTGGGKSTLAKLAAIFREFNKLGELEDNRDILGYYQISSFTSAQSEVTWKFNDISIRLKHFKLLLNNVFHRKITSEMNTAYAKLSEQGNFPSLVEIINGASNTNNKLTPMVVATYRGILNQIVQMATTLIVPMPVVQYIPAERIYLPAVTNSLAAMMRDNLNLPKTILNFINKFISARFEIKNLPLKFLNARYRLQGDDDIIIHQKSNVKTLLSESASGIQAAIPMLVFLEYASKDDIQAQSFIVEEPELNLYPITQQEMLNRLVEKCTKGENDLTITTHSPYILSSCNLLLEAYKVAQQRPDLEEEIAAIVPKECWLNPDEFAAYYVADGTVKPITDVRTHLMVRMS